MHELKLGEVGPGGGTWGPRRRPRSTLKLERTCSARGAATAALPATILSAPHPTPPNPQAAGGTGHAEGLREGRQPGDPACSRPGVLAERVQMPPNKSASPTCSAAKRRGLVGPGAQSRARSWRRAQDPGGVGGSAPSGTATPLPSVTPSLAQDGRAPGADRVHVGQRARSRQAPSSAALAAHGRRRRAPEAGGDRLQPV